MPDTYFVVPPYYTQSPAEGAGSGTTVGTPVPSDQPVIDLAGTSVALGQAHGERVVVSRNSGATTAAAGTIGLGRSTRLLRGTAGSLALTWTNAQTVNGVVGPGSLAIASVWKSAVLTQLGATEFAFEGNIAS